jgi:hypothetical protein
MKNLIIFLGLLLLSFSCSKKNHFIFNGNISIVEEPSKIDFMEGKKIELNDIYTEYMSVYDSLIFFVSSKYPKHYLFVFNLNNGEQLGSFCEKGQGPDDFSDFFHTEQFLVDNNNNIKLWGYGNMGKINLLNLTASIELGKTSVDTIIKHDWMQTHTRGWSILFVQSKDSLLIKSQQEYLFGSKNRDEYTLGAYHLFKHTISNKIKTYHLFK